MDSKFYFVCLMLYLLGGLPTAFSQVIFEDDFEDGKFKDEWVATPAADYGVVEVASTIGVRNIFNNGTYGVALGKNSSSGGLLTNQLELKLDLSSYSEVELSFYLFNNNDATHPLDGLYISDNGGATYKKIMDFDFSNWNAGVYGKLPPIDIDRLAKHHGLSLSADFVIKFQQYGSGIIGSKYSTNRDGYFLDNVTVKVPDQTYISTFPYETSFEGSFDLPVGWKHVNPTFPYINADLSTSTGLDPNESLVRLSGLVQVGTNIQDLDLFRTGQNGLVLGRNYTGEKSVNAVDLHLDLSSLTDVELVFWMKSIYNNNSNYDGIFFSDDGGETFEKVFEFNGDNWAGLEWGQLPPLDIDRLAKHYGLTLTSSFVIRFQQLGDQNLTSKYNQSRDGLLIDDVIVRVPDKTFISKFPYKTGFEGSNELPEGWLQGNPAFPYIDPEPNYSTALDEGKSSVRLENTVRVTSSINDVPAFFTGENGLALGKTKGGRIGVAAADLHLDLSNTPDVELSFWIKDYYDDSNSEDGVYFSDDAGLTFTKVMNFEGTDWSDNTWGKLPPIDIDRVAEKYGLTLSSTFVIRFQQVDDNFFTTSSSTSNRDGFFIDEVEVKVPEETYISTFPYKTSFEGSLELPEGWKQGELSFPYIDPETDFSTAIIGGTSAMRLEGAAEVTSKVNNIEAYHTGENGLVLSKRVGGKEGAVAADLFLDLSKTPDVELAFWMKNNYDESSPLDGIYFSDDGGVKFTKVMDFDGDNWVNNFWGQLPPLDIDRLAKHYGLSLTSTFVIRFQQSGFYSTYSSLLSKRDGIIIDDVEVRVPDQNYIKDFPYSEGFEGGPNLPHSWSHRNPSFPYINPVPEFSTDIIIENPLGNKSNVRLEGAVGVADKVNGKTVNRSGDYGLYLGKYTGGAFGTKAVDLKLNLNQAQNVVLLFWAFSNSEELESADGVFLSVDGGVKFEKIFDYVLNNNKWAENELNISALAEEKKLTLSEKTIIRFQQYGRRTFFTNNLSSIDGIFLDDIQITTKSKISQSLTFPPLPDMQFGDAAFDLVATADSELPVQFTVVSGPATITGKQLTITGAGTVKIKAEQPGDNEYEAAEAIEQSFEVEKANQEIIFGSISKKTYGDAAFTVAATADSKLPVTYSLVGGPGTLSGAKVTITGAGTITVKATQAGNDNYNATSEEKEITVEKAGQTITFANLPDKTYGDQPVDLSASSSSGLAVTFSVKSGPGSLSGDELSIDGAGAIVITASQSGNDNYKAASDVNRTQTVKKKSQTIDFAAIGDKVFGVTPFELSATSSADLQVTYTVLSGPATVSGNTLTLTGAGTVAIEASQAGNDNFNAAETKSNSFCVAPPVPEIEIIGSEFSPELVLKVKNAPTGSTYQWKLDGTDISGADQSEISLSEAGSYSVMVTVDGCSNVSEAQTLTALGERPDSGGLVKLFPNPAQNSFSIEGLTIGETYELTIYDVNGRDRVVMAYKHTENSFINVSGFNSGVYLVEIQGYRVFLVRRLIITH